MALRLAIMIRPGLRRVGLPVHYEALIAWADASEHAGRAVPLPPRLRAHTVPHS